MGDSVICLPKGKKVSPGLSWRCTSLLEDQEATQSWGKLSSPGYSPENIIT